MMRREVTSPMRNGSLSEKRTTRIFCAPASWVSAMTKRNSDLADMTKLRVHHFVPRDFAPPVHRHASEDRCQGTLGATHARVLRLAVADALYERGDRINGDVARRLLHRLLPGPTKMPPVILRRLNHARFAEKLLYHVTIAGWREGRPRQLALHTVLVFERDKIVVAHIALLRRCRPAG